MATGFFQGLFRRAKKPVAVRAKVASKSAVTASGPVPTPRPPSTPADNTEAFSQILGVDLSSPPPAPPAVELDAALLDAIRAHFATKAPALESLPALSLQVLQLVANPDTGLGSLSSLVSRDPALSASVLQVANSAFFQASQPIHTLREALTRLGLREVARVAGIVAARSLFNPRLRDERALFGSHFARLRKEAATLAFASSWLALECPQVQPDRVFLGGLLHDVGKALAMRSLAALVLDSEAPLPEHPEQIEAILEALHVELGSTAHQIWKLPDALCFVCAHHHDDPAQLPEAGPEFHVVRLVSALHRATTRPTQNPQAAWEVWQSAQALKLKSGQLRLLKMELANSERRAEQLLGTQL